MGHSHTVNFNTPVPLMCSMSSLKGFVLPSLRPIRAWCALPCSGPLVDVVSRQARFRDPPGSTLFCSCARPLVDKPWSVTQACPSWGCFHVTTSAITARNTFAAMVWYDMIWYDTIWYDVIRYYMIRYGMIWYDMIWCDTIWYDIIRYGMIWYYVISYDMPCHKITPTAAWFFFFFFFF